MPTIFQLPKTVPLSTSGTLLAGAKASFFETGTNNPKDVYHDFALGTPWTQPVTADGNGVFPVIYMATDERYRLTLTKSDDSLIYTVDDQGGPLLTQSEWGKIGYPITIAETSVGSTPTDYSKEPYDICRYGADPSASAATNTPAIRACILAAVVNGNPVTASLSGTYSVTAATSITLEGGVEKTAFNIFTNLHIDMPGVTLKMADNVSSDGAPIAINMFATNQVLQNVSFKNVVLDMNGANNKISPNRGSGTYDVSKNMAHISVSGTPGGVAAQISDCVIENCWFINTSGTCCIVAGQSNTVGVSLGQRWTIKDSLFYNNGLDTIDHTSVFGWSDDMTGINNRFITLDALKTTKTGGISAWEIHGTNHRFAYNRVINYYIGVRVAANYTTGCLGSDVSHNIFYPRYYGVTFSHESANDAPVGQVCIHDNTFFFDTLSFAGGPSQKACVNLDCKYSVNEVSVRNNLAYGTDTVVGTAFFAITPNTLAANTYDNVVCSDNMAYGLTQGLYVTTNATNGLGNLECTDNTWSNFSTTPAFTQPVGVGIIGNTAAIVSLKMDGNICSDNRGGSAQCKYGINVAGTITNLIRGDNYASGMVTADYYENSPTITNRRGSYSFATVASGTTIAIPMAVKTVFISGTTAITSITAAGHEGEEVTLVFQGALTFTDGSNLKLAGNFVTTADDTITLWCDGTSWFEKARSVN